MRPVALALTILLPLLALAPAAADDDRGPLTMRLFDVGALTKGRTDFIPHQPPLVTPGMVSDEENPLFGAEGEEPILPLGTIDELIELVKNRVRPWFWEEREGADLRSSGEHGLVAKATSAVHAEIGRFLQELDRTNGTMVTIDLQAVRLTTEEAAALGDDANLDPLLYGPGAGPSVSLTTLASNRAAFASGPVRTWIADADVEVAQNAKIPDPFVLAGTLGLTGSIRPVVTPDGARVILQLQAALALLAEDREAPTGATGTLELSQIEIAKWHSTVRLTSGRWRLVDGMAAESGPGGWSFLVRATPHPLPAGRTAPVGLEMPTLPGLVVAPMAVRYFSVRDLRVAPESIVVDPILPVPSSYAPPEPPELPEPCPIFPEEAIVDFVREIGPESAWEDPASLEVRNGILIARNTPPVLDGVTRILDTFRRKAHGEIETRIQLVEIPADVARLLPTGGVLDAKAAALLDEALASGQAVRLAGGRVTSLVGARNAALYGRVIPYVQDYEPEIAEGTAILNPVVQRYLDGVVLDVQPRVSVDGDFVQITNRFFRSTPTGDLRTATAGGGARIELPEVDVFRVGSELMIPLGRTAVAAAYGQGGRRVLLLLHPVAR